MPTSVTPPRVVERLAVLVDALVQAHHDAAGRPQSLVTVHHLVDGECRVRLDRIGAGEAHDRLLGWVAPTSADAVGLVVAGRSRALGRAVGPAAENALAAVVCTRDGIMASAVRLGSDDAFVSVDPDGSAPVGLLADGLRRAVGLPTPAPCRPVADVDTALWLHRVLEAAADGLDVDVDVVDALEPPVPLTWQALHDQTVAGAWTELGVPPTLAQWCDLGIFSRLVLASFPELDELLADLADLVDPVAFAHLVARTIPSPP
ncbi:MAG: hypothetical protein ACXIVQ_00135 [Acidimicrobiales bacterium]